MSRGFLKISFSKLLTFLFTSLFIIPNLSAEPTREPIRIGLTLGLTGKYAEMSAMQKKGFELWASDVNSKGGLLGRKVQLIINDDRSDPEEAKRLYEDMIHKGIDLVLAPYSSEITEAVASVAERHRYPLVASGASADRLWQKGYRYIFGLYTPASRYIQGFLELLTMKGINDLSIIYADDSFSTEVAKGAREWAKRLDLRIKYFNGFKKGTADFEPILIEAKKSGARVIIICGHLDESINARLSLKKIGWNPIYFATVGPATDRYYERLGPDAELTFSTSLWEKELSFKGNREFYERFLKTYGISPNYHAATAYAGGQILEVAIVKVGDINREKLQKVLSTMEAETIIGRYRVNKSGLQSGQHNLIIQWQGGRREIVWPDTVRTAEPVIK